MRCSARSPKTCSLITEEQLIQALAEQMSMQTVSLEDIEFAPELLEQISETMAQLYRVVPIRFEEERLTVATCDPQNLSVQDELRTFLGYGRSRWWSRPNATSIKRFRDTTTVTPRASRNWSKELAEDEELKAAISALDSEKFNITDAEALADSAPVRKLLNMVLVVGDQGPRQRHPLGAVRGRVPDPDQSRRRPLRDGSSAASPGLRDHDAIKVMADLDIAERRLPQDGRIELMVGGHPVDLRVSVLPTIFGESVVMRVLGPLVWSTSRLKTSGWTRRRWARFGKRSIALTESSW